MLTTIQESIQGASRAALGEQLRIENQGLYSRGTLLQGIPETHDHLLAAHHLSRRYGRLLRVRRGII